jgi:hypothetical protein
MAAVAIPPTASAPPLKRRRRVTVSPSYAPGICRSAVYFAGFSYLSRRGVMDAS